MTEHHISSADYCPFVLKDLKEVVTEMVHIREVLDKQDPNAYKNDERYIELALAVKHKLRWNTIPPFIRKVMSKEVLTKYNYDAEAIYVEFDREVLATTKFVGEILENIDEIEHKPLFGEFQGADSYTLKRLLVNSCGIICLCLAFLAGSASARSNYEISGILVISILIFVFIREWLEVQEWH